MNIEISQPESVFHGHFFNSHNKRILFSGPFGSGKTYFLKNFFDKNSDQLNVFWLSPVKYSASQNEDIFEYIKFDIALHLLGKPQFAKSAKQKFGEDQYLYQYLSSQPIITIDILYMLVTSFLDDKESTDGDYKKLLEVAKPLAQKLADSYGKYKAFKDKVDAASTSINEMLVKYLTNNSLQKGSIFEDDLITQTIRIGLSICKADEHKDNILVIDDFDRLDPEHVFRILNILSVHNDTFDNDNKFGFDKIMIVCDYYNISKIYAHKYGSETNFSGYINKFFSTEVFNFNNSDAIQYFCKNNLFQIVDESNSQSVLAIILSYLVDNNIITIRDIVKIEIPQIYLSFDWGPYNIWETPKQYKNYHEKVYQDNRRFIDQSAREFTISSNDYPFLGVIKVLSVVFGGYSKLFDIVNLLSTEAEGSFDLKDIPLIIKAMLPLSHHASKHSTPGELVFSFKGDQRNQYLYLDYPKHHYYSQYLTIPVAWDGGNLYDGKTSYYNNLSENLSSMSYREDDFKDATRSFKTLFKDLKDIIVFLDSTGKLRNLGLTKGL